MRRNQVKLFYFIEHYKIVFVFFFVLSVVSPIVLRIIFYFWPRKFLWTLHLSQCITFTKLKVLLPILLRNEVAKVLLQRFVPFQNRLLFCGGVRKKFGATFLIFCSLFFKPIS